MLEIAFSFLESALLDMLCASIWKEYRVGPLHPPSAISCFARIEVCPVVVVVHSVLVVIRVRLLLERLNEEQ